MSKTGENDPASANIDINRGDGARYFELYTEAAGNYFHVSTEKLDGSNP